MVCTKIIFFKNLSRALGQVGFGNDSGTAVRRWQLRLLDYPTAVLMYLYVHDRLGELYFGA